MKVWCFPYVHGVELGHIALQINEYIYGFYPAQKLTISEARAPGNMKKQTEGEVAEDYLGLYLGSLFLEEIIFLERGQIIPKSAEKKTPLAYIYTVELPIEKKQDLLKLHEKYHDQPPLYDRKKNNCVTLLIDAFSNILFFDKTFWPDSLREQLAKRIGSPSEQEKGKVVAEDKKEVGYRFTWRLISQGGEV